MNFLKLKPAHPLYQKAFGDVDIRGFEVANQHEIIGKIADVLTDNAHSTYYFVIEVGNWLSHRQVLVPSSQFEIALPKHRLYMNNFSKAEAEHLPDYVANHVVERKPEVEVSPLEHALPLEASQPLEMTHIGTVQTQATIDQRTTHHSDPIDFDDRHNSVERQPIVNHSVNDSIHVTDDTIPLTESSHRDTSTVEEETIRLLEERLIVDRQRHKAGEVIVRKVIETHMVEVPVRREKLIVEQVSPEHKQLATVDLHQLDNTTVELSDVDQANHLSHIAEGQAISVRLASRILNKLSSKFDQTQVELKFSDPELQAGYQKWLSEHHS